MIIRYLDLSGYLQCNYNTVQCNAIQEQYSSSIPIHGMLLHCDIRIYTCVCTEKEHSMHTHRGTLSPKPPNSTDTRLVAAYCAVGVSASFTSVFLRCFGDPNKLCQACGHRSRSPGRPDNNKRYGFGGRVICQVLQALKLA